MPHKFVFMEMKLNHRKNIKSLKEILKIQVRWREEEESESKRHRMRVKKGMKDVKCLPN